MDEWARMGNPRKVWQAIEPTMAGSCHIVTTGLGPTNYSSTYWRRCLAGDARHQPCFIGALTRPDRTQAWLKAKRASMDEQQFRQEYPSTWEDALSGGGEFVFRARDLDAAGTDFYGLEPAKPGRKYVKAPRYGMRPGSPTHTGAAARLSSRSQPTESVKPLYNRFRISSKRSSTCSKDG